MYVCVCVCVILIQKETKLNTQLKKEKNVHAPGHSSSTLVPNTQRSKLSISMWQIVRKSTFKYW